MDSCWKLYFMYSDEWIVVHGMDMAESLHRANNNNMIQMYRNQMTNSPFIVNWNNIASATENICSDDPSCPVYLRRHEKINAEIERLREASDRNYEKMIKEFNKKRVSNE